MSAKPPTTPINPGGPREPREPPTATNGGPPLLHPYHYVAIVLLGAADIALTRLIIALGGREVNSLALWVLRHFDIYGLVIYKFALIVVVVLICEAIGRRKPPVATRLAEWAIALTAVPVVVSIVQLVHVAARASAAA